MNQSIIVNFETDNPIVMRSILAILDNTLPYMTDNCEIEYEWNE